MRRLRKSLSSDKVIDWLNKNAGCKEFHLEDTQVLLR